MALLSQVLAGPLFLACGGTVCALVHPDPKAVSVVAWHIADTFHMEDAIAKKVQIVSQVEEVIQALYGRTGELPPNSW